MRFLSRFVLFTLLLSGLLPVGVSGIATIDKPITTPFGVYQPKSVTVKPSVPQYAVPEDLSGVLYADQYTFSDSARAMLVRNGFVATPVDAQSYTAIYKATNDKQLPVFVTTDALLHTFFKTYDYLLRIAEYRRFYDQLDSMLRCMLDSVKVLHASTSGNDSLDLAITRAAALLDVAHTLLTDTITFSGDSSIREMVTAETSLVFQHSGFAYSKVVPALNEDYSQYVPRGHYTLDTKFEHYFRSMMYLGRINLSDSIRIETMTACVLTRLWATVRTDKAKVSDLWAAMYNPTAFFVGFSDDQTFTDYAGVLEKVIGATWRTGDVGVFHTKLTDIMNELENLPQPRILSGTELRPGLRIMGQRFVPDSYAFGQLVYEYVGTESDPRLFPRGLDALAVLGSVRARKHLIDMYHEDQFLNYATQLDNLTTEFAMMPDTQWAASLYWNWLYTLVPLLQAPGKGYPFFMSTGAWADKALTSASGSWVELRHATILYAKQSYTTSTGVGPGLNYIGFPQGYVEPYPDVFGRMAAMASYMKNGLSEIGLSDVLPMQKLSTFETLCNGLRDIAVKELENLPLSIPEYCDIAEVYKTLDSIVDFKEYKIPPQSGISVPEIPDTSTAIIADVHTDPNTERVLEVGTGKPMCLYVVVPVEGKLQICRGAMFSYYEFLHPMNDRLTDAQWQARLASSNPEMPQWTAGFTAPPVMDSFPAVKKHGSYSEPIKDLTTVLGSSDSISGSVSAGDTLIAILQSDTIPYIVVESNSTQPHFGGILISSDTETVLKKYRVTIPSSVLSDTNILTIHCTGLGGVCRGCNPPVTSPPVIEITYRRVVYKNNTQAIINRQAGTGSLSHPRFIGNRLTVPPGTSWRIIDPCGRLVAFIGPDVNFWAAPPHLASKLLLLVPTGANRQKPMRLVVSR